MTDFRAVSLSGALLLTTACSGHGTQQQRAADDAAAPRAVSVAQVTRKEMDQTLSLSGVLVAREEAAVSSQLSGYPVLRVLVDQDDQVRAGQPLAILDSTLLSADIAQQRAVVAQQQVGADKAQAEAARVAGLEGSGAMSSEAIAERRLAARTAAASVAQAQAALHSLLVKEQLMTIRAPVSGRVLERAVRPGEIAAPGTVMFRLERDNLVEVDAEVPEQSIDFIKAGQTASVSLQSGATVSGTVRLVSAQIDKQTKLGRARVLMAPNPALRPGGFATVNLAVAKTMTSAVPASAIRHADGGDNVLILDKDNRVRSARVKTGAVTGPFIALNEGPAVGSRVVTGGQEFLLEGEKVSPKVAQ